MIIRILIIIFLLYLVVRAFRNLFRAIGAGLPEVQPRPEVDRRAPPGRRPVDDIEEIEDARWKDIR